MRKRIIQQSPAQTSPGGQPWLDIERLAQVEISSEDAAHPIETALRPGSSGGWRAAHSGEQLIRLQFDVPQQVQLIHLLFSESEQVRTQEFALRWSPDDGRSYQEIVRQQYNFSPPGTTSEVEDYQVQLNGATVIELRIVPNMSGGDARASLEQLYLA